MAELKGIESSVTHPDKGIKSPNVIDGAKEDNKSPHHHKETHGTSDDIDENTPTDEVKGPSVLQRAKEEVEAVFGSVVEAIHPKK